VFEEEHWPLTVIPDGEHGPAELACLWRTIHHEEHTHVEHNNARPKA
jgi:hypothetical protein